MRDSVLSRLLIVAFVAASVPATAAVTARGAVPEDNPRAAWLDRYTEARQGSEQTDRVTQTFKVGPDGSLDLSNLSGDVRVTAGGGNEIKIEAIKRARHRDGGEAKALLDRLRVEINNVGGRVEVRAVYPRNNGRMSASVDFAITVPASAAVALKTISGNIVVTNVRGEVRAESISGDLELTGTSNVPMAKTVSGTLTARGISDATLLTLASISGSVVTADVKTRALDANTVSGDLLLRGLQVERLEAKSVSGNVEFASPLARGGRYSFNSHSGDVRVGVLNGAGFELDASTFSGSVRSDFPITRRSDTDGRGGRGGNRTIRGTYGDASAFLSVRSFSGSVVITKQ
jgi:Putative adhesin